MIALGVPFLENFVPTFDYDSRSVTLGKSIYARDGAMVEKAGFIPDIEKPLSIN